MKNLIVVFILLLLPIFLKAQNMEQFYEKWSSSNKNSVSYWAKYEGVDGLMRSFNVLLVKSKDKRPNIMIWMMTGSINEPGGINLQVGENKVVNVEYNGVRSYLENGFYYNKAKKENIDILAQLLNSKIATISFDDAGGMAHMIKVPLEDFQKEYAKLK